MIKVLWHGRGGQGAFTGARLLGAAWCSREGHHALAFPTFGPERRGAPMRAFTKLDTRKVGDRSAVAVADVVIYLDETLFGRGFEREVAPGGVALVNTARGLDASRAVEGTAPVLAVDANGISEEVLGRPIPNTALLGAISTLVADLGEQDIEAAIRQLMPPRLHERNIEVVARTAAAFLPRAQAAGVAGSIACETAGSTREVSA